MRDRMGAPGIHRPPQPITSPLDCNPPVRVARLAEGDDRLDERGEGGNEGPEEQQVEDAQPNLAGIEVVDAQPAHKERQQDVRHLAHQLATVGRARDVRAVLLHERLLRVRALARVRLPAIARLSFVGLLPVSRLAGVLLRVRGLPGVRLLPLRLRIARCLRRVRLVGLPLLAVRLLRAVLLRILLLCHGCLLPRAN